MIYLVAFVSNRDKEEYQGSEKENTQNREHLLDQ
jgi:hypothetical protein